MKSLSVYYDGYLKSVRSFRSIVLLWIISLAGSMLIVAPLERNIGRLLDGSMASELLYDGFNIDVFADLMYAVMPAMASFSISFILVTVIVFLANTFVTAGLFRILAGSRKKQYKWKTFLMGADRGFTGFLFVAIIAGVSIVLLLLILAGVPLAIASAAGAGYTLIVIIVTVAALLFIFALPVVLLTADYARAMLTADKYLGPWKAITRGFRKVRKRLWKAWVAMIIILLVSALVGFAAWKFTLPGKAVTGGGLFLLLIISQLFVFLKVWIKVIRYGTVTAMKERW
ncbi:MAG: hypothetical protein R6W67_07575 [Bacteroidales bacterium]